MTVEGETERVHEQDERRQGDIISIEHPVGHEGPTLGIVINADCDLEHRKTDGAILYLPLYSFKEYLSLFWMPGQIENARNESIKRIVELTKAGDTGPADLNILMNKYPPSAVADRLKSLSHVKDKDHAAIDEHIQKIDACTQDMPVDVRFAKLCCLQKSPEKYARTQIEHAKNNMGEGHFFVSEISGKMGIGFVVRMRRIFSVPENSFFTSVSAQRTRTNGETMTAIRFARLTPLFKFKILQIFGQQYARIGLPDAVTSLSSLAIDDLVSHLTQGH